MRALRVSGRFALSIQRTYPCVLLSPCGRRIGLEHQRHGISAVQIRRLKRKRIQAAGPATRQGDQRPDRYLASLSVMTGIVGRQARL